jgi:hypothetical protein
MDRQDLNNAVNFALNNFKAPKVRVLSIKYLSSKDEYKVRISETDEYPARGTVYFPKPMIERCLEWYKKGARQWAKS